MLKSRLALLAAVLAAVLSFTSACGSSPTAPPPTPAIAVSQNTVLLERTAAAQVTATSTVSNATTDITATATWRSSNEQVARVAAGLITAVGPGTATVTVEHSGASQAVAVTVRRRVYLEGEVTVTDGRGAPGSIAALIILLDDRNYGGRGFSSPQEVATAPFGNVSDKDRPVAPGTHRFDLQIPTRKGDAYTDYPLTIVFGQPARVVDLDTREQVGTVSLENRSGTFRDDPTITWPFTLSAFTS